LQDIRPEASSVNAAKICYNSRDIEFFSGKLLFGGPCTFNASHLLCRVQTMRDREWIWRP